MALDEIEVTKQLSRVITIAEGLADDVRELKTQVTDYQQNHVSRGEWTQRNNLVDQRFRDVGREVSELRTKHESDVNAFRATMQSRQTPWYQTAVVIIAAGAICVTLGSDVINWILSSK